MHNDSLHDVAERGVEKSNVLVPFMEPGDVPWFPAWGVDLNEPINDVGVLVGDWIERRPSDRWALIAGPIPSSDRHLWASWHVATRNEERDSMVARTIDAEFIRILAGTHQIRLAFDRIGPREGDGHVWIVYLPRTTGIDSNGLLEEYPAHEPAIEQMASDLMPWLNGELRTARPVPNREGADRLEIPSSEPISGIESSMIMMAASADIR